MDFDVLLNSLKNAERDTAEFKKSLSDRDSIGNTIAAFATSQGGTLYIGVDKKGNPVGFQLGEESKKQLFELASKVVKPSVKVEIEEVLFDKSASKYILSVRVPAGNDVYAYKGVPYIRDGDMSRPLSMDEALRLKLSKANRTFDKEVARNDHRPGVISDISVEKVHEYRSKRNKPLSDLKQFLVNADLLYKNTVKVTNAGILLFGKDPQEFVPSARIRISVHEGTDVSDTFTKKLIQGTLYDMLESTYAEIMKNNVVRSIVSGFKRIDVPDYPAL